MEHIEIKLRDHILGCDDIKDKIGEKFRPMMLGQGDDMPAGVYQKISSNEYYTHDGSTKLVQDRFQLSFMHKRTEYAEIKKIIKLVKERMDDFVDDDYVYSCFFEDEGETYEENSDFLRVNLDYMISYSRSDEND